MANKQLLGQAFYKSEGKAVDAETGETTEPTGRFQGSLDDELVLSSGRVVYVHGHTIGISADLKLSYGWDGGIDTAAWSQAEKHELADIAIALWNKYKASI